jgi:hypothetical protein
MYLGQSAKSTCERSHRICSSAFSGNIVSNRIVSFSESSDWYCNAAMSRLCANEGLAGTFLTQSLSKRRRKHDRLREADVTIRTHRINYSHFLQRSVTERHGQDKKSPAAHACVALCKKVIEICPNLSACLYPRAWREPLVEMRGRSAKGCCITLVLYYILLSCACLIVSQFFLNRESSRMSCLTATQPPINPSYTFPSSKAATQSLIDNQFKPTHSI